MNSIFDEFDSNYSIEIRSGYINESDSFIKEEDILHQGYLVVTIEQQDER